MKKKTSVTLWLAAHTEIEGNKGTDKLAKKEHINTNFKRPYSGISLDLIIKYAKKQWLSTNLT